MHESYVTKLNIYRKEKYFSVLFLRNICFHKITFYDLERRVNTRIVVNIESSALYN